MTSTTDARNPGCGGTVEGPVTWLQSHDQLGAASQSLDDLVEDLLSAHRLIEEAAARAPSRSVFHEVPRHHLTAWAAGLMAATR